MKFPTFREVVAEKVEKALPARGEQGFTLDEAAAVFECHRKTMHRVMLSLLRAERVAVSFRPPVNGKRERAFLSPQFCAGGSEYGIRSGWEGEEQK